MFICQNRPKKTKVCSTRAGIKQLGGRLPLQIKLLLFVAIFLPSCPRDKATTKLPLRCFSFPIFRGKVSFLIAGFNFPSREFIDIVDKILDRSGVLYWSYWGKSDGGVATATFERARMLVAPASVATMLSSMRSSSRMFSRALLPLNHCGYSLSIHLSVCLFRYKEGGQRRGRNKWMRSMTSWGIFPAGEQLLRPAFPICSVGFYDSYWRCAYFPLRARAHTRKWHSPRISFLKLVLWLKKKKCRFLILYYDLVKPMT